MFIFPQTFETNLKLSLFRKAEMEARRKEEEARRLRQEEEDRKAALALQVMDSRLLNHFSTFILELLLIIPKHRPSWKRKPRRTSSTASSWSRNGATMSWPSGWPKNPTARSRTAHRCWESMYLVFVWSEFFFSLSLLFYSIMQTLHEFVCSFWFLYFFI